MSSAYSNYNTSYPDTSAYSQQSSPNQSMSARPHRTLDPYETEAYNGFSEVTDPSQYLNAPSTLLTRSSDPSDGFDMRQAVDSSDSEYFEISPLLNTKDPMTMHFMVQSTLASAKGYKILSYQELDDLRKEQEVLRSRMADVMYKYEMELKVRDAAASLSKLHLQRDSTGGGNSANGGSRRSFLKFNSESKDKKRLSRHAEDELNLSNRKIDHLHQDFFKLNERLADVNTKISHHDIAILAYTHSTSANKNEAKATPRMKNSLSGSVSPPPVTDRTSLYLGSRKDQLRLDETISKLKRAVSTPTVSPRMDTDDKSSISNVSYLCDKLLSKYETTKYEKEECLSIIHQTIYDLSGNTQPDNQHLGEQVATGIAALKQEHQEAQKRSQKLEQERVQTTASRDIGGDENDDDIRNQEGEGDGSGVVLLKKRLQSLNSSYESNRRELEKLELENVDLKTSLRDTSFSSQAKIQSLENELKANTERVTEWRERCDGLQTELESVVKSLEDVTRQAVDYESEREKLESQVNILEKQLLQQTNKNLDKRVSMIGSPGKNSNGSNRTRQMSKFDRGSDSTTGREFYNEPASVSILRHEFRKIVMDINQKHSKELKNEQGQRKKLESLLRSIKHSSYAINIPPGKLEALELSLNA